MCVSESGVGEYCLICILHICKFRTMVVDKVGGKYKADDVENSCHNHDMGIGY